MAAPMSLCPKCRDIELARAPKGIRALRCPHCKGTWLPRDEAKLEVVGALLDGESTIRAEFDPDQRTGLCPMGHGILIRAKVELEDPFHLERCVECHGIWFDPGEWHILASSHLLEHLDQLWDPAWRHALRRERAAAEEREALAVDLGRPTFELLGTLANALRERSPRLKSAALAWLAEELAEDDEA